MAVTYPIPRPSSLLVDGSGATTREWYNYFNFLAAGSDVGQLEDDIRIICEKLGSPDGTPENIPPFSGGGKIVGIDSITTYGALPSVVELSLDGDVLSPGNTYYYGTNGTGSKSFYTVASAFLGTTGNITLTTGSDGVTTINLAAVTQGTAGTLRAITLDGFGRVVQNKSATITGTANRITVTNGDASAGLPTIDIASNYAGQTSITMLGTVTTGTWNASIIQPAFGGTGISSYAVGDLIYASGTTTLSRQAIGTAGQYLGITGGIPSWRTILASEVNVDRIAGSTYSTLQQFINTMHSPGTIDGPTPVIVDLGSGNIRVLAGKGMVRIADDDVSSLPFFDWAQTDFTQAADGFTRFYGVTYNGGSPLVVQRTTYNWDFDTEIPLGSAVRFASGATVVTPNPYKTGDPITNIIQRFDAQSPAVRDASIGGLIIGNTGTRTATLTAGKVWSRLSDFSVAAKNSSTAPLWSAYFNGTNLTVTTGITQWDNSQYNTGGALAPVPNNKYSDIYFFLSIDGTTWGFAYGQNFYNTIGDAVADTIPTYLTQNFFDQALLLGRIVFQQGNDTPISVDSAFVRVFNTAAITDHNNLSGIQDAPNAVTNEHYHMSSAQATDIAAQVALGTGITAKTGTGTYASRTITAGTGISITNGNGVSGNPTIANTGVTSVALAMPAQFAVTGSPVTTTGTLTAAWNTQAANTALMGPSSGAAAAPTFRALASSDVPLPSDYISANGLRLIWVSSSSIQVTTGSCVIPSTGKTETYTSALTISSISLGASTWGHVYAFDNAGTPAVECVTTAPASPYQGSARAKTGDTTRRYIGSVKSDASGNLIQFVIDSFNEFRWLIGNATAPLRCLSNGKSTVSTSVSLAGAMPITATHAILSTVNSDTSIFANLSNPFATSTTVIGIPPQGSLGTVITTFPTDASQNVSYFYSSLPANGLYIDCVGFAIGR